jgi:cell division septum initiation protein DivIVA
LLGIFRERNIVKTISSKIPLKVAEKNQELLKVNEQLKTEASGKTDTEDKLNSEFKNAPFN